MSWDYGKWDINDCDREPIHQIGHVQSFGGLIAVTADWMVAHFSANCSEILGFDDNPAIGQRLSGYFSKASVSDLHEAIARTSDSHEVERLYGQRFIADGPQFDVAIHQSGPLVIIEFEPHEDRDYAEHVAMVGPLINQLQNAGGVDALCTKAASLLKQVTGFDRVMTYRFHGDGSGEVVAEAREEHLDPYLGLRYPRTDIPQQARELFRRNPLRIIADMDAAPVPIEPPVSITGNPVDLSMSVLRAQSAIHVEYLKNMGVEASLSIAIVVKGELWGLFACHHYSPRLLPYSLRTVLETFAQVFSLMLDRDCITANEQVRARGKALHEKLMVRLAGGEPLIDSLPLIDEVLEQIIPHDGSSVYVDGTYRKRGNAPSREEFEAVIPALNTAPAGKVIATKSLSELLKSAKAFADTASGAMIIPVSRSPRDYLVLWRKELPQKVTWAGNPEKAMEESEDGNRLSPRKSFAAWSEELSGASEEWTEDEIEIAESLRTTLIEVVLRLTDEALDVRSRAQEQQELLIAELNHRVRNILNLIRGLVAQSKGDTDSISEYSDIIGGRIAALASAHDNITRQNWSPAPFSALVAAEVEAYLNEKRDRLHIEGEDVFIAPEAYTVLALVMHEMVTNSAKYGSLCDSRGELRITLRRDSEGNFHVGWREHGGPEVQPPKRRGFGSTIIERSIPFELEGKAELRFQPGGLEADFMVPARFVREAADVAFVAPVDNDGDPAPAAPEEDVSLPEHVLLVEDSMIIAMDTEDSLNRLGISRIDITSSCASALDALAEHLPDLAIVDFNLGDETSEPVIKELVERGIPFVLATGYGEATIKEQFEDALGLLTKPYGKAEIATMLERFAAL